VTGMQTRALRTLATLVLALAAASLAATAQTYTDLYNFGQNSGDPYSPNATTLTQGRDGNFYSGAKGGAYGYGVDFKITTSGAMTELLNSIRPTETAPLQPPV
jgi:hypothetical protein